MKVEEVVPLAMSDANITLPDGSGRKVRVALDDRQEKIGYKIREAPLQQERTEARGLSPVAFHRRHI